MKRDSLLQDFPNCSNIEDAKKWCEDRQWIVVDACEGRSGIGLLLLFKRGTSLAGIVRENGGFSIYRIVR